MEEDFIYWRHPTVPGIKVEEVTGGDRYKGNVWRSMAEQVYCENGREAYREIGHFADGAPFLFGETSRISITHCAGLYAVATLPPTPEVELSQFSRRAAMGIDAERMDRAQVLGVRERFLSPDELAMIAADDVQANVLAWTIKEAAYKAALHPGLDLRSDIIIRKMPRLGPPTPVFDPKDYALPAQTKELPSDFYGEVTVTLPAPPATQTEPAAPKHSEATSHSSATPHSPCTSHSTCTSHSEVNECKLDLRLYSYLTDDFIVTLCFDSRCAKFGTPRP